MPQVYWVGDSRETGPTIQLQRTVKELQALKNLPVVPIGSLYGQNVNGFDWKPCAKQIANFSDGAKSLDCPGLGWWSWDSLAHLDGIPGKEDSDLGWWPALLSAAKQWQENDGDAEISLEKRVDALEEQALAHGWTIGGGIK